MVSFWEPGSHIITREIYAGKVWTARPVTVVQDTSELTALYMMPGTIYKHPRKLNSVSLPDWEDFLRGDWQLIDATWCGGGALYLSYPGDAHMVVAFYDEQNILQSWYVNLQEPFRRMSLGFDYLDQELDIVIAADLSAWRWKDEESFKKLQQLGRFTIEQARQIRTEGERVIAQLQQPDSVFRAGWERWKPPTTWALPQLPAGWDIV